MKTHTLLAVDDRPENLFVLKQLIAEHLPECSLVTAESAEEGFTLAAAQSLDGALIDVQIPGIDGIEMCRRLKADEANGHLPILLMTAHGSTAELRIRGLEAGADDFISRPVDNVEVVAKIRVMLRIKRAEDELRAVNAHLEELVAGRTRALREACVELQEKITEHQRAEEELRQFKYIVSNSNDMLALLDKTFVYLAANEAYLRAFGKSSDELIGHMVSEIFGEEFFDKTIKPNAERCLAGDEVHYQTWVDFPVLGRQFMDVAYFPFLGSDKEVKGFVARGQDITERKRAEETISESEQRFRDFFEKTPVGLHIFAPDQTIIDINDAELDMIGYSREEIVGKKTWQDIVIPAQREKFQDHWHDMITQGQVRDLEYTIVHKQGCHIDVILNASSRFNENGNLINTRGSVLNITERRRTEKQIEDLAKFPSENPHPVMRVGADCTVLYANAASRPLLDSLGSGVGKVLPAEWGKRNARACDSDSGCEIDVAHEERIFSFHVVPVRGAAYSNWYGRDVTERERAEEALRESEERFDLAVRATSDGIWDWNILTDEEYFSPAWCEILGYSHDDPELQHTYDSWASRIHPDDCDHVINALKGHFEEGKVYDVDYRHRHKSGEYRWQNSRGQAIFDEHGKPVRMVGCIQNITERKRAEKALQEVHNDLEERVEARTAALARANEQLYREMKERELTEETLHRSQRLASLGTLAAGIAHEINNPLQGITFSAEVAIQKKDLPGGSQRVDEVLGTIKAEAMRCGRIVKSVLQFARQEVSEKWPSSLDDVVHNAADLTCRQAARKQVFVRLDLGDSLPLLTINPTEMEQVLVNLISNAIEASEVGDSVSVRTEFASDGAVRVAVEDRGCGMSKEEAEHVFDPFFSTRKHAGGTGLGLSIVYGIVEEHGGTIRVESRPGEGSMFTFELPVPSA